jgi:hypothetical protein
MGQLTVRRMLFTLAALSLSISPYATLMPAVVVKVFDRGAETVGLFIGAVGLGAFIAAINLAMKPNIRGLGKWIGLAPVIAGLGASDSGSRAGSALLLPADAGRLRHVHVGRDLQHDPADHRGRGEAKPRAFLLRDVLRRAARPLATTSAAGSPTTWALPPPS